MANCEKCIKSDVCKHYEPGSTSACKHYAESLQYGHWLKIKGYYYASGDGGGNVRKCSVCGKESPCGHGTPYCAICGAKMSKEVQNEQRQIR